MKTTLIEHAAWCAVPKAEMGLCQDFGCRGQVMTTRLGKTWLTVGSGDTPDIAIDPAMPRVLTPDQALEVARVLVLTASAALYGPATNEPQDSDAVVRGLGRKELVGLLRDLHYAVFCDSMGCRRPERFRRPAVPSVRRALAAARRQGVPA